MNVPTHRPPRFLLVRLSAIGDCILTLPLAVALKKKFPRARLTWVVEGAAATLINGHPAVDDVIRISKGFLRSPGTAWQLRNQLREQAFDVSIDPQGLTKSAIVAWAAGAPERIGFARPVARELSPWLNNHLVTPQTKHLVERQLELLKPLGIEQPAVEFQLPAYPEAHKNIQPWLEKPSLRHGFAVINPGAGWDSKLWPADRFAAVARQLGERCGLASAVVWNGPREENWAQEIVAESGGWAHKAPPTRLRELAELCRAARLFLGSDTGPLHLAAAVGIPCVGLYGPSKPELCGPYGSHCTALQAWYQEGTSRERRAARNDAMQGITVNEAVSACERQLTRYPRAAA